MPTTKIEVLPVRDYAALERAAQLNRSILLARALGAAFRRLAGFFSGNQQEALRFRGGARA